MDYTSNIDAQGMRRPMGPVEHYTKTGSSEDKERMEERGKEHVDKAIISMRDIWSEASPELKRAMKTELSTLVDNMTI